MVMSWMNKEKEEDQPTPIGFCHFPNDYPKEYYNQLKSEKCIESQDRNGYPTIRWEKIRDRNEALDLFVYNAALADFVVSEIYGPIFKESTGEDWGYNKIIEYLIAHREKQN